MTAFRFTATNACLTYPQCDEVIKTDLYEFLLSLRSGDTKVDKILLAQEKHSDGNKHYHAYIRFDHQPNIRDATFFDYHGKHPNVQPCRRVRYWIKYITKDDSEPLSNFEWQETTSKRAMALGALRQGIKEEKTFRQCMDQALDVDPALLGSIGSLEKYYRHCTTGGTLYMPSFALESFALTAADYSRMLFYKASFESHDRINGARLRSLWFVGPSWLGKTSLARSIGKHWYMSTVWHLDELSDQAAYGVVDEVDLSWDTFRKYYKSILGCQRNTSYTDKYRSKRKYNFGMPVVACSNVLPAFTTEERDWLAINVTFFKFCYPVLPKCNPQPLEEIKI